MVTSSQWSRSAVSNLLGRGDDHGGLRGNQLERRAEALQRQQLAQVRPLALVLEGQLRQLPVLRGELRGGRELHPLGVIEGALSEGREPADHLDLVAEQLQPRGPVLGGPEDVEDPAADRELPALLDLVDALVSGLHQPIGDLVQVDLGAALEREARRAKRRVGHRLGERHGAGHDHRGIGVARARPAPRSAGRRGAAAAPRGTRSPCPATGSSGQGEAPGRRAARGPGRAPRCRRPPPPAPGGRRAPPPPQ